MAVPNLDLLAEVQGLLRRSYAERLPGYGGAEAGAAHARDVEVEREREMRKFWKDIPAGRSMFFLSRVEHPVFHFLVEFGGHSDHWFGPSASSLRKVGA